MDNIKNFQNEKAMLKEAQRHQMLEQMQKNKTEQEQGITLVALVITIIVLLILAGIVISMVNGANGILGRAKNAINNYKLAELDEQNIMDDYEKEIDELFKESNEPDGDDVKYEPEKDPEPETKVNGSSADWQVNDAGDTIVAYIGGPISSDTIVVPNYVDDKKIVKLGDGQMPVFLNKGDVTKGKKLKISRGIEEIGSIAFCAFVDEMKGDLILHEGMKKIGDSAFVGCSGFDGELKIYEGLEEIGGQAFRGCSNLNGNLIIPSTLENIKGGAFENCPGMNGTLTVATKDLGQGAFSGASFTKVVLTDKVTTLKAGALADCSELTGDLIIPDSVTTLQAGAFSGCQKLDGKLKVGAKDLPDECFSEMNFKSLVLKNTVETIGSGAFYGCSKLEGNLAIPSSVKTVGSGAFAGTSNLKGILAIGMNDIEGDAFKGTSLTQLLFANTVNKIGDNTFAECSNFTGDLIIPNNVSTIGSNAFRECKGFTGDLIISSSVQTIGEQAFAGCGFGGKITINEGVKNIKRSAFAACNFTGELRIPKSVTTIESGAFYNCSSLAKIILENKSADIASEAFPEGVTIE